MFTSNINKILGKKKMKPIDLVRLSSVSRPALLKVRQDEGIGDCRLSTLGRIANALDVPVKELFDGEYEAGEKREA